MSETLSMHSSNWQKLIAMMLAIPGKTSSTVSQNFLLLK